MIGLPSFIFCLIRSTMLSGIRKNLNGAGMGRFTQEQRDSIGRKDLDAIASFLGEKVSNMCV